ncbi:MAG: hypothetical protein JWQ48_2240 [Conexibacter sp.]|nr:hypothetical protein [Conexibacter sp.]
MADPVERNSGRGTLRAMIRPRPPRLGIAGSAVLDVTPGGLVREADRARLRVGIAGLWCLLVAGGALALAAPQSPLLAPRSQAALTPPLAGPFAGSELALGAGGSALLIAAMLAGYLAVVRGARVLPAGPALAAVVVLHVAFALAPPLFSSDVFSYIAYGRMGALHAISPYLHGPDAIAGDPSYPFTGLTWVGTSSVYGPLFTLLSYALAPLGLAAAMWTFKLLSAAASLACVALVWSCARRRGVAPLPAALLVGLNPLLLVWAVGGGHNDLLMIALMLAGVRLALARRGGAGAAAIVSASAMKLSAGILLPFLALGMRGEQRRRTLAGAALTAAALALATLVAFGTAPFGLGSTIGANAGDWHSIPGLISRQLLGTGAPSSVQRLCLSLLTLAICLELARRVWRNRTDWIAAAGWATFWTLLLSPVLAPWYVVWLTPLAALGDRRLRRVALAFTVLVVATRLCDFLPGNVDSLGLRPPTG